ncbi:hypothetical protein MWU76_20185 [Gelidibacter sp. F2691]|nr:hypothetical protein [Gelidibacter sp. F2691]
MKNILFVCGKARKRSPTAAEVMAQEHGVNTDYAGLSTDADERLNSEHLEWADVIVIMERRQLKRLNAQFPDLLKDKRVVSLGIPDDFEFMQPELVQLVRSRRARILG